MDDETDTERAFGEAFRARTKELRENRRMTQKEVADFLGIGVEAYKKYENRAGSVLPQWLIPKFCRLIGCEIEDLFAKPLAPPPSKAPPSRPKSRKH